MRLRCGACVKSVSTEVAVETVVRAWLECPECIEKQPDLEAALATAQAERDAARAERDSWRREAHEHAVGAGKDRGARAVMREDLTEARRVLRLVMHDPPCTQSSCHRCVETRAALAAVLAQEGA